MTQAWHTALGPGGEFDLVRRLVARWGDRAAGIGDDAAVLDVPHGEQLVASVDTAISSQSTSAVNGSLPARSAIVPPPRR